MWLVVRDDYYLDHRGNMDSSLVGLVEDIMGGSNGAGGVVGLLFGELVEK